jgi:hypothetical protein
MLIVFKEGIYPDIPARVGVERFYPAFEWALTGL